LAQDHAISTSAARSESSDGFNLRRKAGTVAAFLVALALVIFAGNRLDGQIQSSQQAAAWVVHSGRVKVALYALTASVLDADNAVRAYALRQQPSSLNNYHLEMDEAFRQLTELQGLTADNPLQQARLLTLRPMVEENFAALAHALAIFPTDPVAAGSMLMGPLQERSEQIRGLVSQMNVEEERLLALRNSSNAAQMLQAVILARWMAAAGILLMTAAFVWVLRVMYLRGVAERRARAAAIALEERQRQLMVALEERDLAEAVKAQRERQMLRHQGMGPVERLAAGLAHVFNNALTVIIGQAELILLSEKEGTAARSLAAIIDSAESAAKLTRQFQSFGQQQYLQPEELDLNIVLEALRKLVGPTIMGGVVVELVPCSDVLLISIDPHQLLTALTAAVENSLEAMPDGGTLTISINRRVVDDSEALRIGLDPGPYARVSICDTGKGMSEETMEHAFQPFFTTKNLSEGAGLGLSMLYGFARQSGGSVSLASRLGAGTDVSVYLPMFEHGASRSAAQHSTGKAA
jgi:signal transduction histidine kinase